MTPPLPPQDAPPDRAQRDLILTELDRSMLVEAAAGTGKTTSMIGRMIALLRTGKCAEIRTLAGVTFTRKAAAELRIRFQVDLEKAVQEAAGEEKARLKNALDHIEQCYIGTIHSFCARLLRERPVEANVDVAFEEMEDADDFRLREEAWEEYTNRRLTEATGDLAELDDLGLRLSDLKASFLRFADFPDVDEWPAEDLPLPDLSGPVEELLHYVAHIESLAPQLPDAWGNDTLIPVLRRIPRVVSHYDDLHDPVQLMDLFSEHFDASCGTVQKEWAKTGSLTRDDAKAEQARWEDFRARVVQPVLRAWREYRYPKILRMLFEARDIHDEMRHARGRLSYQDLLMKAADLLRGRSHVREYFQRRITHLLVDEFQDTDPIQAEMMLLLTADRPEETNWRRCRPRPGSLFVVGDPKQSIYRFRRADIVTYDEVKRIITGEGLLVRLSANFRSTKPVVQWVNSIFEPSEDGGSDGMRFPKEGSPQSPQYVALDAARGGDDGAELSGLYLLHVPAAYRRQDAIVEYEADRIARTIRHALDTKMTVSRPGNTSTAVAADDFLIITRNTARLSAYAQKLQEYGIPHQVTGGAALNQVPELKLLQLCLTAVIQPDNPVALVAALRSELFGVSDRALYAHKKAGGAFSYHSPVPDALDPEQASVFQDALSRLRRYWLWLSQLPPVAAFGRIIADLGLSARAAARPGGDVSAGSLAKVLEVLRGAQADVWTTAQLVDYVDRLVTQEEKHDGISARAHDRPAVRIMNLHKVKGLEAPVVFLADPYGDSDHPVTLHIDRSGDTVLGFMAVYGEASGYRAELLAVPRGWDDLAAKEKGFSDAEALRLRYVAATRAGAAMIITDTAKRSRTNPWSYLASQVDGARELPDPGPQLAPRRAEAQVTVAGVEAARTEVAARVRKTLAPTYRTVAAKAYALSALAEDSAEGQAPARVYSQGVPPDAGESGIEWGAVIHLLLQFAMRSPKADLRGLATAALAERELDPELAGPAISAVQAVMRSDLWQRALRSARHFVEVPFQVLRDGESAPASATQAPTLVRGAIDLIFREPDGWVLVDFKTDRLPGGKADSLIAKYAPQVRLYADAWRDCTGEPVKEMVLYFTQAGTAVVLP